MPSKRIASALAVLVGLQLACDGTTDIVGTRRLAADSGPTETAGPSEPTPPTTSEPAPPTTTEPSEPTPPTTAEPAPSMTSPPVIPSPPVPNLLNPGSDLLDERIGVSQAESQAAINTAFQQLFFGDAQSEAVYRETGDGAAYIEDIANGDVRTDSMSYGMFVTVQLKKQELFDKLWAWPKRYMLHLDGRSQGLLDWSCGTDGSSCKEAAATDATSVIASALLMAHARWGSDGVHDYRADANVLIDAMVLTEARNGGAAADLQNPFDVERALPRTGSAPSGARVNTDYLMPAFYEYWAMWRPDDAAFWRRAAVEGRELLKQAAHAQTGLFPRALNYDGVPVSGLDFHDAISARSFFNLALDQVWFAPGDWVQEQSERRLDFFLSQGVDNMVAKYTLEGAKQVNYNTAAHASLVALAVTSSSKPEHSAFLEALWARPVPTGRFRYFDGMLYLLSLIVLSGHVEAGVP